MKILIHGLSPKEGIVADMTASTSIKYFELHLFYCVSFYGLKFYYSS